jgi:hypothetical protein
MVGYVFLFPATDFYCSMTTSIPSVDEILRLLATLEELPLTNLKCNPNA